MSGGTYLIANCPHLTLKRPPLRRISENNYFRFSLSPEVIIAVGSQIKKPGEQWLSVATELKMAHDPESGEMDAYERLLGDAMIGDGTLFARQDAVEAAWTVVQPVLGNVTPVHEYQPGTWGPKEADRLTEGFGGWHRCGSM